jgi:hypothetical protein
MLLCRSISDKSDVNAWIKTGPKAEKLYKGFEPALNQTTNKLEVSVNRCSSYSDFLMSAMAVRATRSESIKNTPVIVAISIDDNMLTKHGIEFLSTPDNGLTGFSEIDRLHFDLVAENEEPFRRLAIDLYTSHLKTGNIIHTLNNGCLLRGCKSLLELCSNENDHESVKRIKNAATWLEGASDVLDEVGACQRPTLWDSEPTAKELVPHTNKINSINCKNWRNWRNWRNWLNQFTK